MTVRRPLLILLHSWALLGCCSAQQGGGRVTRADLLVSIHTSNQRLALVRASRAWRRGVRTVITSDQHPTPENSPPGLLDGAGKFKETWRTFQDIGDSELALGPRSGDLRAAIAPFVANLTAGGTDKYKWILYGDDDTVFNIDGVLKAVSGLNPDHPYLLTDALWFPEGINGDVKVHPNREAPRCLPCEYQDPLLDAPNGARACAEAGGNLTRTGWQFPAPRACGCTRADLCKADVEGRVFNNATCDGPAPEFKIVPGDPKYPHAGWWYMLHGGAGALMSAGLMRRASYQQMEDFFTSNPPQSGDGWITRAIWNVMGIGPTDPGPGYCRPNVQVFDPGFRGYRARGAEDAYTGDGGADPTGVIARLELLLDGRCDAECQEGITHLVSVHVKSKYAAADFLGGEVDKQSAEDMQPNFRVATYLIRRLGVMFERVARKQRQAAL